MLSESVRLQLAATSVNVVARHQELDRDLENIWQRW
jgi:hypothetical protein